MDIEKLNHNFRYASDDYRIRLYDAAIKRADRAEAALAEMTAERVALTGQVKARAEFTDYLEKKLKEARDGLPSPSKWLDQALNEGDGVYRP